MNSIERRKKIENMLMKNNKPIKGNEMGQKLGVTRQVIVKDIAILRASGRNIIATPEGYLIPNENKELIRRIIAVCHDSEDIKEELETIIKFGGIVEDVVVEHPVYGEIKAMLMIKSMYDIDNFIKNIQNNKAEPLLILTGGIHLHTISSDNEDIMNKIIEELNKKNYLVDEEI
ncbi:transcription repressor NadR [Clostridium sporogenes]|uniref:Transcription repressor NadR n=2 Tax=Clostridium TaxID=1485 RepID=A0AAU8Z3Z8_CLOBO|nr:MULTISPECIES: transcription repressor NadR [Clostridium]AJD32479.1 3H domain protein [Clostridium botulinum Prevot_594]AVP62602.1 transcription repressor NadR [Clostridium botulinum]AKC60778.1 putative transcription repressor NiaR [Clostridium sporogenes]AKJ88143.1 transcriptional regulator [Clostridium sporogenes]AVP66314.1 transcription repressor NadR [Clostridium botulinum]